MPPPDKNAVLEPPASLATDSIADLSDETLGKPSGVVSTPLSLTENTGTNQKTPPDADTIIMTRDIASGVVSAESARREFVKDQRSQLYPSPDPNDKTLGKPSRAVSTPFSLTENTGTYQKTPPDADTIIMTRDIVSGVASADSARREFF